MILSRNELIPRYRIVLIINVCCSSIKVLESNNVSSNCNELNYSRDQSD